MPIAQLHADLVEVTHPVSKKEARKLGPLVRVVQFSTPLKDSDHQILSSWIAGHSEVTLRVYGRGATDLDFLHWYPRVSGFSVDCAYVEFGNVEGLRYLPDDLKSLSLGIAMPKGTDLGSLARFGQLEDLALSHQRRLPAFLAELGTLRRLHLEGPVRDLDALAALTTLTDLTLRSVTADLSPLLALHQLDRLAIKLGGCADLKLVPKIGHLTYLELWMVRGLTDLSFVGEMTSLEYLFLQALRGVVHLPDLSRCTSLRRIHLETMKGLHDLRALASAPALRRLNIVDAGHLTEQDLLPLRPLSIEDFGIGLGSDRKNSAARQLLQLPGSYGGLKFPVPAGDTGRVNLSFLHGNR